MRTSNELCYAPHAKEETIKAIAATVERPTSLKSVRCRPDTLLDCFT